MRFTEPLRTGLWLALILLLSACATGPGKELAESESELPAERSPALPAGPVTANPYLARQSTVSRSAQARFEQALAAIDAADWPRAERLLLELSESNPELSGPQLNLGLVRRAQGDAARAEQAFRRALEINGNNLDAWNQLAILKRAAGDFSEAERLYRQALAVWPFHPESHRHIGILYDLYLGEWQRALEHYQAYQQLLPEPDRQVNGWIVDLERRIAAAGQGGE
jgi:tetratricopeptide (TPR) repeat protein